MNRQDHWNAVYATKRAEDVSWFESVPTLSLRMIEAAGITRETCILDVGGGDSRLVDQLVTRGLTCLAVLDVSGAALERARARIGSAGESVAWIEADAAGDWTSHPIDIWHDRAAFHFLTVSDDRERYVANLRRVVKPTGTVILATFALDGPERCSGLPVTRYSAGTLAGELGEGFTLIDAIPHIHRTPWGATQSFLYSRFQRTS
jgi:ubiquinone/menaquinone biosynthesis C-methylase UbiE